MKAFKILWVGSLCVGCYHGPGNTPQQGEFSEVLTKEEQIKTPDQDQVGQTIEDRVKVPQGYSRSEVGDRSFQSYLRTLPVKPKGTPAKYYNGSTKPNYGVYTDVVDLEIGKKDLHQCADAVMRLKAEYLWKRGKYEKIHFNFTNGHRVTYQKWRQGHRMQVRGNKTSWVRTAEASNTYDDFWNYMELIFTYAGTASLEKEMIGIDISQADIGDVLIQGGYPGHAVIIVDKAIHQTSKAPIFLLAQSYMPAQETHILTNPMNSDISPWYELKPGTIKTPEWTFGSENLKRFEE